MRRPATKGCSKCGYMFSEWKDGFSHLPYDHEPVCRECEVKELKDVIDKVRGR